jgi:hypothetical protein
MDWMNMIFEVVEHRGLGRENPQKRTSAMKLYGNVLDPSLKFNRLIERFNPVGQLLWWGWKYIF